MALRRGELCSPAKSTIIRYRQYSVRRIGALESNVSCGITTFLCDYAESPTYMVVISADEYGRPQVAPTVERMVKQFKGAITKKVGKPIWQKSFIEHVIRNIKDYETRLNYIYENPIRWYYDELYTEE